jgi:REP element-mobilizing transposase RayT
MKFDPTIHHRRSIRLQGYDYRQAGGYFVTIVTQGREMLFGEVVNGEMELNPAGEMIVRWWLELPNKFPNVNVDIFMPMPNHFHGVIFILAGETADVPVGGDRAGADLVGADLVGANPRVGPANYANDSASPGDFPVNRGGHAGPPLRPAFESRPNAPLSQMIQWFKTMTTNEYIRGVKQLGWKPFDRRLWQRNYPAPRSLRGTNTSFATNPNWTASSVTSNPTRRGGLTITKTPPNETPRGLVTRRAFSYPFHKDIALLFCSFVIAFLISHNGFSAPKRLNNHRLSWRERDYFVLAFRFSFLQITA